jgi:hypothetical protein
MVNSNAANAPKAAERNASIAYSGCRRNPSLTSAHERMLHSVHVELLGVHNSDKARRHTSHPEKLGRNRKDKPEKPYHSNSASTSCPHCTRTFQESIGLVGLLANTQTI